MLVCKFCDVVMFELGNVIGGRFIEPSRVRKWRDGREESTV